MKEATAEILNNLRYTHKMHEKQCEIMSFATLLLRIINVVFICAILALQFWQIMDINHTAIIVTLSIIFTVLEVGLAFYQLNFNYDKLLDQHRTTAKMLLSAKNNMIVACAEKVNKAQLESLVYELNEIYAAAPQTGRFAKWLVERDKEK